MLPRRLKTDGSKMNRYTVLNDQAKRKKDVQSNCYCNSKFLTAQACAHIELRSLIVESPLANYIPFGRRGIGLG